MLGILILLGCLALGWQTYRRPTIGLVVSGFAFAIETLFGNDQSGVLIAGLNVYAADLATLILFQAALLRLAARPWRTWGLPTMAALVLGLILLQSFGRGVLAFGLKPAGLAFRMDFTLFANFLFGLAFLDLSSFQKNLIRALDVAFLFLMALILARWLMVATGLYVNPYWGTSTDQAIRIPMRVVGAREAILLAQISILWLAWRRHHVAFAWCGLLVVLLLQHRSVWLAALIGGGFLAYQRYRAKGGLGLSLGVLKTSILTILVMTLALARLNGIRVALEASTRDQGTWVWRLASWAAALAPSQMTGWVWIYGKPYGTPATRFMLGHIVDTAFHSHYVSVIVQTGVTGLCAWLGIWALGIRRANKASFQTALILSQMIYGIAYSNQSYQGLLLALAFVPGFLSDLTKGNTDGSLLGFQENKVYQDEKSSLHACLAGEHYE